MSYFYFLHLHLFINFVIFILFSLPFFLSMTRMCYYNSTVVEEHSLQKNIHSENIPKKAEFEKNFPQVEKILSIKSHTKGIIITNISITIIYQLCNVFYYDCITSCENLMNYDFLKYFNCSVINY
jgi:hypothetical protein